MTLSKAKRTLAAACLVAATGVMPMAMAAPASASASNEGKARLCMGYLSVKGYTVGNGVKKACRMEGPSRVSMCADKLKSLGVSLAHRGAACHKID
ncbi:hypothetical protein [Streptomyces lasiicapitis]|uniref:hypothetical protein n=1 Tax=Streptomyces lasiicapitis TaxID=1923961 RepID=UPI00364B85FA